MKTELKINILPFLLIGLAHLLIYFVTLSFASPDGSVSTLQPDTALYCQSARRIVEGHPFSYSEGELVSTGTTSVLQPFLLAIPYAVGLHGNQLLSAGFVLNALFYLVYIVAWMLVSHRLCVNKRVIGLFSIVLVLSAQPIYCALGQTDIGLWMAVSAVLAALLVYQRWKAAALVAFLAPWIRPEGFAFAMALMLTVPFCKNRRKEFLTLSTIALISTVFVFAFNFYLTGRFQFDSVAHKGYFKTQPLPDAIGTTYISFVDLLKTYFLGLAQKTPFVYLYAPLVSGLLFFWGMATRKWHDTMDNGLGTLILAGLGSFFLVATSGWQGVNFDRYLVWAIPLVLMIVSEGAVSLAECKHLKNVKALPFLVLLGFTACSAVVTIAISYSSAKRISSEFEYYSACENLMAAEDKEAGSQTPRAVGGLSCGGAYYFGSRRFVHFAGLYSPAFFDYYRLQTAMELLKNRPELRPTYLITEGMNSLVSPELQEQVYGRILSVGPSEDDFLRLADWSAFERGAQIPEAPEGKSLTARLDVGYLPDEHACDYEVIDRWRMKPREVFFSAKNLGDKLAVDAGRIIRGGDMMTIPLKPGRDCTVVVRTLASCDGVEFNSPIRMLLNIDDKDVGYVGYDLNLKTNAFQEVSFKIPGKAIRQTPSRIGFLGDHIACGYWFFQ